MTKLNRRNRPNSAVGLQKEQTGISGFDEITGGGLPAGRPTLVCGTAGAGKTLFAMEFLVRGATIFNEPGVFISFEETDDELAANVASLGFDLKQLIADKKLLSGYPDALAPVSSVYLRSLLLEPLPVAVKALPLGSRLKQLGGVCHFFNGKGRLSGFDH